MDSPQRRRVLKIRSRPEIAEGAEVAEAALPEAYRLSGTEE
jgi:hypothetical protein